MKFKLNYTSLSTHTSVESKASTRQAIVGMAAMSYKDFSSITFSELKDDGWKTDTEALALFDAKLAKLNASRPNTALASELATLGNLSTALGKLATKKVLSSEQKQELVDAIMRVANVPAMAHYFARPEPEQSKEAEKEPVKTGKK